MFQQGLPVRPLRRSAVASVLLFVALLMALVVPAPILSAAAPLGASTVGDYVWFDFDQDGDYVGDPAEAASGIPNVALELYKWNGTSWVLETLNGTVTGKTTTDATGYYSFPATAMSAVYKVVVADSNFLPGGPLAGHQLTSAEIYPQPFSMPNSLLHDYRDADFGFYASPLLVDKVLLNTTSYAAAGDTVTFRITVKNAGSQPLNPVPLDDFYSPACLQYIGASTSPDLIDTSLGRLHWNNLGPLNAGFLIIIDVVFKAQNTQEMYWKEGGWQDYAPKGVPDFDQKQADWDSPTGSGQAWYRCAPVAAANSLWWFDSKYEADPKSRPLVGDTYPLIETYGMTGEWDDHDPKNVPPLVNDLSTRMGTTPGTGTTVTGLANGLTQFIADAGLATEYAVTVQKDPTFAWVGDAVRRSEDVIVLLGFWQASVTGAPAQRIGGHYVTVTGVEVQAQNLKVALSDPYRNSAENGGPGRILPGVHASAHPALGPAGDIVHNDAQYISQDAYLPVSAALPPGVFGVWGLQGYLDPFPAGGCAQTSNFQGQNSPDGFTASQVACSLQGGTLWTTVEYAVVVAPKANTVMCSPTTNIAAVTGARIVGSNTDLPPAQSEEPVTQAADWGDLLDPGYPTLAANNGPRHLITSQLRLGQRIDGELNGQPSNTATGDDLNGVAPADEDGVIRMLGKGGLWSDGTVANNQGGSLQISITGGRGVPQLFMDFGSGALVPVTLRDAAGTPLPATLWMPGTYRVYFDIPLGTFGGESIIEIPVRVRLSSAGGLPATGQALDGEVEDYIFNFAPNAVEVAQFSAVTSPIHVVVPALAGVILGFMLWTLSRRRRLPAHR